MSAKLRSSKEVSRLEEKNKIMIIVIVIVVVVIVLLLIVIIVIAVNTLYQTLFSCLTANSQRAKDFASFTHLYIQST